MDLSLVKWSISLINYESWFLGDSRWLNLNAGQAKPKILGMELSVG